MDHDWNGNSLDLEINRMVGQEGHLVQVQLVGTDSASDISAVQLTSSGTDTDFDSSEISDFAVQIYPVLYSSRKKTGQISVPNITSIEMRFSRPVSEKSISSKRECQNMI